MATTTRQPTTTTTTTARLSLHAQARGLAAALRSLQEQLDASPDQALLDHLDGGSCGGLDALHEQFDGALQALQLVGTACSPGTLTAYSLRGAERALQRAAMAYDEAWAEGAPRSVLAELYATQQAAVLRVRELQAQHRAERAD